MKKNVLLVMLCFHSAGVIAGDCVFVVFGGSKAWVSLFPTLETDLSIDVGNAISKEANRTGCRVITMANDNEKDFLENLKKLKNPPYNKPGTTYHFSFSDHGMGAQNDVNKSLIVTGLGEHTTYAKLVQALKEDLPKGSHVTFETNTCWPNFSEAIIANNLEEHFDICGSSSTSKDQMSWNLHELSKTSNGKTIGPYGAVGLHYANEYKKYFGHFPSVSEFHFQAKLGDAGNIKRQPGTSTSLAFANLKLKEYNKKSAFTNQDIFDTMTSINWKNDKALENFLNQGRINNAALAEQSLTGACSKFEKTPYTDFLKNISSLYQYLMDTNSSHLPGPYDVSTEAARLFFLKNQKKLAALLENVSRERAEFIQKNQHYPRERYPKVEEEWKALLNRQSQQLSDYQFNFRLLQEGKNIQTFIENAPKKDYNRFMKLLSCENRPML